MVLQYNLTYRLPRYVCVFRFIRYQSLVKSGIMLVQHVCQAIPWPLIEKGIGIARSDLGKLFALLESWSERT